MHFERCKIRKKKCFFPPVFRCLTHSFPEKVENYVILTLDFDFCLSELCRLEINGNPQSPQAPADSFNKHISHEHDE